MATVTESKVLVIYTGGTIGMLSLAGRGDFAQGGLAPEPFFLTETLRSQSRFHDPFEDSLFSHSSSVEGFRRWNVSQSNSGCSSPQHTSLTESPTEIPTQQTIHRSLVRSSRPIAHPLYPSDIPAFPDMPSKASVDNRHGPYEIYYETQLPTLVTPRTHSPSGFMKRIRYAILEWHPLLDSSNMEINDWVRIATEIDLNYHLYDAFVILHGTDTMCYTSSALSFMLEELGKTVIITGAQIPLSQLRNDAFDNFLGALWIAGHYTIPECCVFFDHMLFRGNRATKASSFDLNAFSSPNFPPLVKVGIDVVVNWGALWRPQGGKEFKVHRSMSSEVVTLRLFPGITAATVRAFMQPPIKGVVLETFGAGNAPDRADLNEVFKEAYDRGVIIVAISQCMRGNVQDMYKYQTGRALRSAGIIPGGDMTTECVLAKLAYLLSKPELDDKAIRKLVGTPIRGELTATLPLRTQDRQWSGETEEIVQHIIKLSPSFRAFPEASVPIITIASDTNEATEILVENDVHGSSNATENALRVSLIHIAVSRDDVDEMRFAAKMDEKHNKSEMDWINALDVVSGRSPLHTAAIRGANACACRLIEAGALVHLRDALNHTALYYAIRQGHKEIADLLLKSGAHLNGADLIVFKPGLGD